MRVCIFVNGEIEFNNKVRSVIENADILIAADGGGNYTFREGISLDYLIGDFDSISSEVLEHYKSQGTVVERYPSDKDYTDTELCLMKAIELSASEVYYIGGIGDRLDHSLSNIHLLYKTLKKGIKSYILSKTADIFICENSLNISGEIGETVSIIPLLSPVNGITLKGFKYLLNDADFEFGDVFGTCNVLEQNKATISIKEGCLIVIKQYNI
ncbi:MAG: thiamine diphosphokinase [Clostridium sp.]